jgi:acyl-CoA thioesterase II
MADRFFDLRSTHNPHRWFLPVTRDLCVGPPGNTFLFGGVGLAAAIAALEETSGRPLVWATAQYLSYARPGSVVDLDVRIPVSGKHNTQARLSGHVGDQEILTVNAALGSRPSPFSHQWASRPDAPPPRDCPVSGHWRGDADDLHSRLEVRVAHGRFREPSNGSGPSEDGRLVLWIRSRHGLPMSASLLAVFADFIPSGVGAALGMRAGGNSLDNTLRIRSVEPTEWVLCDVQIQGVHGGFGHGSMNLFSESGVLMASASQSLITGCTSRRRPPAQNRNGPVVASAQWRTDPGRRPGRERRRLRRRPSFDHGLREFERLANASRRIGLGHDAERASPVRRKPLWIRRHEDDPHAEIVQPPRRFDPGGAVAQVNIDERQIRPRALSQRHRLFGIDRRADRMVAGLFDQQLQLGGHERFVLYNQNVQLTHHELRSRPRATKGKPAGARSVPPA